MSLFDKAYGMHMKPRREEVAAIRDAKSSAFNQDGKRAEWDPHMIYKLAAFVPIVSHRARAFGNPRCGPAIGKLNQGPDLVQGVLLDCRCRMKALAHRVITPENDKGASWQPQPRELAEVVRMLAWTHRKTNRDRTKIALS
jgi:hypothetical protein